MNDSFSQPALELEFYFPQVVWQHPATVTFLKSIAGLEGATIVGGAKGMWRGEVEDTAIARCVLRQITDRGSLFTWMQSSIQKMMAAWARDGVAQESFLFLSREVTAFEIRL